ncbi:MAG: metallophosphoesterase [Acidobacteriota bacterium]
MNNVIIGIGDLHGHYRALERILDALQEKCGVFGAGSPDRLRTGVQLVFTGDYIDRGRHALRIIDRLQRLAHQNPGQVITLLGNHELMALEASEEAAELLRRSAASDPTGDPRPACQHAGGRRA